MTHRAPCGICGKVKEDADTPTPCVRCMELAREVAEHFGAGAITRERVRQGVPFPTQEGPSLLAFYWLVRLASEQRQRRRRRGRLQS